MRIATWNMDHWRRSADQRAAARRFLFERVRPDVALLQETMPWQTDGTVVFRPGGVRDDRQDPPRDLQWGSAVVSFGPRLRAVSEATCWYDRAVRRVGGKFAGSAAVADVGSGVDLLLVVSAYGLIDRGGYAHTTVHDLLNEIEPLIDERKSKRIVIAGDLNITTQWSKQHTFVRGRHDACRRRDQNLLDLFSALGFTNVVVGQAPLDGCGCGSECRHVQTQKHDRSSFPWQNDYLFVTDDLLERKPLLQVFDEDEAWALSGHCPVAIEWKD